MQLLMLLLSIFLNSKAIDRKPLGIEPGAIHVTFLPDQPGITRMRFSDLSGTGGASATRADGTVWPVYGTGASTITAYLEFETTSSFASVDVYYPNPNNPNQTLIYCNPGVTALGSNWYRCNTALLTWPISIGANPTWKFHLHALANCQ